MSTRGNMFMVGTFGLIARSIETKGYTGEQ